MSGARERTPPGAGDDIFRAPDGADGAAAWRARLEAGDVDEAEWAAFNSWLDQSPTNRQAFARLEALWREIEPLKESVLIRRMLMMERESPGRGGAAYRLRRVAALAAIASGAAFLWFAVSLSTHENVIRTGVGERRVIALSDGSRVTLNTASALETMMTSSKRRVRLIEGQAAFDVATDAARPFVVLAGPVAVRATGTRFDVYRRRGAVEVTLIEGAVDVIAAPSPDASPDPDGRADAVLAPGDQILVAADGRVATAAPVDLQTVTDWRDGRAYFRETPLGEAIAEMNRYSNERIILAAAGLEERTISGVFTVGDNERFAAALVGFFDLRADPRPSGEIILTAPDASL